MFTDHEAAIEEADFLANTEHDEIVIITNKEAKNVWVISSKKLSHLAYRHMRVLERFKPSAYTG